MSVLRNIASGLRSLFRKERVGRELDEELNGFLEMAAEEKMKQGMSRKDALRESRSDGRTQARITLRRARASLPRNNLLQTSGDSVTFPVIAPDGQTGSSPVILATRKWAFSPHEMAVENLALDGCSQ